MTSKIRYAVVVMVAGLLGGCATTGNVDYNGGGIPSLGIAGSDTSSERGPARAERVAIDRGDHEVGHARVAPSQHEALVCRACR